MTLLTLLEDDPSDYTYDHTSTTTKFVFGVIIMLIIIYLATRNGSTDEQE